MNAPIIDPVWEQDIYSLGRHLNRYPYDCVVSFVYRRRPRDRAIPDTRVLELGCGAGNNLWFAAREGFKVSGIDGSASAVAHARQRFAEDKLTADFQVGTFTELPWADELFDLVIDRCSLTCTSFAAQQQAVAEARRVMRVGGSFFHNVYSDRHTSASSGRRLPDGRIGDISAGSVTGVGALHFSSERHVRGLFEAGWRIESCEHVEISDHTGAGTRHCEWRVVVTKR